MGRRVVVVLLLCLLAPGVAKAAYAPVDRPGPTLSPSASDLASSLRCTGSLERAGRDPVLLLGGTTITTAEFSWNYVRALSAAGIPFCTSDEPGTLDQNLDDIQLRGEYVVYALREMARRSGRKVAVFGHSQGGMVARWALRFWPDTRKLVSDVVGAAPSNHGTVDAVGLCAVGCAAGIWQQREGSAFYAALNSRQETFAGIDYTAIGSRNDEVVVPHTQTQLSGPGNVTNVDVQDLCPADPSEHLLTGTSDPVAYALFRDAIDHPGPADPSRISRGVCDLLVHEGVEPLTFATDFAATSALLARNLATYPHVPAEPAPACYVTDPSTCSADRYPATAAAAKAKAKKAKAKAKKARKARKKHRRHRR